MNMRQIITLVFGVALATSQAKAMFDLDPVIARGSILRALESGDPDRISWERRGQYRMTVYVYDDKGTPLLHLAVQRGADCMRALIEERDWGENVIVDKARDNGGCTPLHIAALKGCENVAAVLLEHGANPNATSHEGWTPLHSAVSGDHKNVAALLIAKGSDHKAGGASVPENIKQKAQAEWRYRQATIGRVMKRKMQEVSGGEEVSHAVIKHVLKEACSTPKSVTVE